MLAFALLVAAITAAWLPSMRFGERSAPAWLILFAGAVVAGFAERVLSWPALVSLALLLVCAFGSLRAPSRWARGSLTCATALIALALALHRLPGFANPVLLAGVKVSVDGVPFTQYLNFDKGAAGLVLLAAYARRLDRWDSALAWRALSIAAATVAITLGVAIAIGHVRFDPKLPAVAGAFLLTNLFFTCVAEEAFFRGLLQERIGEAASSWRFGPWFAAAVSAVLFGLVHVAGGSTVVLLATLGGLGYSVSYLLTRRIEAAVFAHFALNTAHFLGFTYPYLIG